MSPIEVVELQLEAYNQKDIDKWIATYSIDAVQLTTEGGVIARGKDEIRQNILERFKEPDLHAKLLERRVFDDIVIDHELITRNFPEGLGTIQMLCIYTVKDSSIVRGEFKVFGKKILKSHVRN